MDITSEGRHKTLGQTITPIKLGESDPSSMTPNYYPCQWSFVGADLLTYFKQMLRWRRYKATRSIEACVSPQSPFETSPTTHTLPLF
jgi:hypothetical protein